MLSYGGFDELRITQSLKTSHLAMLEFDLRGKGEGYNWMVFFVPVSLTQNGDEKLIISLLNARALYGGA